MCRHTHLHINMYVGVMKHASLSVGDWMPTIITRRFDIIRITRRNKDDQGHLLMQYFDNRDGSGRVQSTGRLIKKQYTW